MTTPFIGLSTPIVAISSYIDPLNSNLDLIDDHDHVTTGNTLNQDSISWSELNMEQSYIYNAGSIGLLDQTYTANLQNSLYVYNSELFFYNSSNNSVQITKNGFVNSLSEYNGFYGDLTTSSASCSYEFSSGTKYYYVFSDIDTSGVNQSSVVCSELITTGTGEMPLVDVVINVSSTLNSQSCMYSDTNMTSSDVGKSFFIDPDGYFQTASIASTGSNVFLYGNSYLNTPTYMYQDKNTVSTQGTGYLSHYARIFSAYNSSLLAYSGCNFNSTSANPRTTTTMLKCMNIVDALYTGSTSTLFTEYSQISYQRYIISSSSTTTTGAIFQLGFEAPISDTSTGYYPVMPIAVNATIMWQTNLDPSAYICTINKSSNVCSNGISTGAVARPTGYYYFDVQIYDTANGVYIASGFYLKVDVYGLVPSTSG